MAIIVSNTWKQSIRDSYERADNISEVDIDIITGFNKVAQWLVTYLTGKGIAYKIINLGAGVKRITTKTETCPKCNGTGKC